MEKNKIYIKTFLKYFYKQKVIKLYKFFIKNIPILRFYRNFIETL
jgi:hypothetical protein